MPSDQLTESVIPMLGGYKVCGGVDIGPIGYMDSGSVDFIQTSEGIQTRAPMYTSSLFGDPARFTYFILRVNASRPAGVAMVVANDVISTQIIDIYPYRPEQEADDNRLMRLGRTRWMVVFKLSYFRTPNRLVRNTVLVFYDMDINTVSPLNSIINPTVYLLPETDGYFYGFPIYPSIDVGYFKKFFIVTFPNAYHLMPLLLYWIPEADPAMGHWGNLPWISGAFQPPRPTVLPRMAIPTVCVPMTVSGAFATFLVWGCSEDGSLRTTQTLTSDVVDDQESVQRLLSAAPSTGQAL